ncbi:FtsB family cell division protein [Nocardioides rubriscoriae]|uniref:FtsB family cell division protein n=1 Tax=Nocardioides rubriscoriae TaxID=642762 RepID=UPI0011DF516A|nr:septum formation initiator family protein [Nocardioides rubriscoriae]
MSTPGSGRRTSSRGSRPAGRSGPGRTTRQGRPRAAAARPQAPARTEPRARLTSRAAILVLIVALLAVSASSLARAYLQQRHHLDDVQARITASESAIERLEDEKSRLDDPAYVEQQARELGFVRPGEKPFVVLDGGDPLDVESTLSDPSTVDPAEPRAWWDDAWGTMKVAGNPPRRTDPLPQTKITDPEGAPTDEPTDQDSE